MIVHVVLCSFQNCARRPVNSNNRPFPCTWISLTMCCGNGRSTIVSQARISFGSDPCFRRIGGGFYANWCCCQRVSGRPSCWLGWTKVDAMHIRPVVLYCSFYYVVVSNCVHTHPQPSCRWAGYWTSFHNRTNSYIRVCTSWDSRTACNIPPAFGILGTLLCICDGLCPVTSASSQLEVHVGILDYTVCLVRLSVSFCPAGIASVACKQRAYARCKGGAAESSLPRRCVRFVPCSSSSLPIYNC